jgi:hypothetical protein
MAIKCCPQKGAECDGHASNVFVINPFGLPRAPGCDDLPRVDGRVEFSGGSAGLRRSAVRALAQSCPLWFPPRAHVKRLGPTRSVIRDWFERLVSRESG